MDQPDEELAKLLPIWPNCSTPDCPNKTCLWSPVPLCYPCSEFCVGREVMRLAWIRSGGDESKF